MKTRKEIEIQLNICWEVFNAELLKDSPDQTKLNTFQNQIAVLSWILGEEP